MDAVGQVTGYEDGADIIVHGVGHHTLKATHKLTSSPQRLAVIQIGMQRGVQMKVGTMDEFHVFLLENGMIDTIIHDRLLFSKNH